MVAAVVGLGLGVLAGSGSPAQAAPSGTSALLSPAIPLTGSSANATTTWATLAMGHLDDPLNTFWQLLRLSGTRWKLATPPGVASNGGLVAAAAPASVLAAFGPSQDLRFSPLAATTDQGSSWQAGVLPGGVSLGPDALAQGDDESVALLSTGGGEVVSATTTDLSTWTPVTTASALRRRPGLAGCHLRFLTAVARDAHGATLVGATCAQGGHAGLFAPSSGGWTSTGPAIPGGPGEPTEVVRLDQTAAGTAALVSAGSGAAARLYGMWSATGVGPWTVSVGLSLDGASLRSTGVTAAGGFVVSTRRGRARPSASVLAPGSKWKSLRPLPAGTTSVTAGPAGSYDALVPVDSTLSVYGLESNGWARVQTLRVAIPYGSSN
jgi:hypothetical protein